MKYAPAIRNPGCRRDGCSRNIAEFYSQKSWLGGSIWLSNSTRSRHCGAIITVSISPWNTGRVFDVMAFRLFVPILAGATLRERIIAC
ncbi:hypothetical protein EN993_33710, partial [Mesorhizobium sp. M7D.F.Ca.US.004.01.2.1]